MNVNYLGNMIWCILAGKRKTPNNLDVNLHYALVVRFFSGKG